MKKNLILSVSLASLFTCFQAIPVYAASPSPVSYSSQPTVTQNIPIGQTLPLTYVLQNSTPTVLPLQFSFTPPGDAPYSVQSITTNVGCPSGQIPAMGTCTVTVTLAAGSATGVAQGQLVTLFGGRGGGVPVPDSEELTINTTSTPLIFQSQPTSPQTVTTNNTLSMVYTVQNPNTAAVQMNSEHYTPSALFTNPNNAPTIAPGCVSAIVPGNNGTCTLTVGISTGNLGGSAFGQLSVDYGTGSSNQLTSSQMEVNVTAPLEFTAQPTSQSLQIGSPVANLTYTVRNNTSSNIVITPTPTFSSSTLLTSGTITMSCGGTVTASGGTCDITVPVTAGATAGNATGLKLSLDYTSGSAYTLNSQPITVSVTPTTAAPLYFSEITPIQNMTTIGYQTVLFYITNTSASPQTINSSTLTPTSPYATTTVYPCSSPIAGNSTCIAAVIIVTGGTASPGPINQTLTINYGASNTLTTPVTYNVSNSTSRTVTFVNQCSHPVWIGINAASVNSTPNVSTTCTTAGGQSNCPNGATCVATSSTLNQCFWTAPVPNGGNYELAPAGQPNSTNFITFPVESNPYLQGEMMNLTFAGRTACDSANGQCTTADCSGGTGSGFPSTGACKPGIGFNQPATQMEINFYNGTEGTAVDTYDGEMINGFNVPLSAAPSSTTGGYAGASSNPYVCGVAGGIQTNGGLGLGNCTWNFPFTANIGPNSTYYQWVTPGGAACSTSSPTCSDSTQICGLSLDSIQQTRSGGTPNLTCGTRLGFWNANEVCGKNSGIGAPFYCYASSGLASPFNDLNMTALYSCQAPPGHNPVLLPSCYTTNPASQNNQCCGCQNWQSAPTNLAVPSNASYVQQCPATASTWTSYVLPLITPFKSACPSLYAYQYDDKSSTFTCNQNVTTGQNALNYTVTFCPAGAQGTAS